MVSRHRRPGGPAGRGRRRDGAAPMCVEEELSARAVAAAGVFDPRAITALWQKCRAARDRGQLSNADNMALVGVVSTQVLLGAFVATSPSEDHRGLVPRTVIDLVPPP